MHRIAMEYPAFSGTARLAKRWVNAHMFCDAFTEEAIELMVAQLFLQARPYVPPGSAHIGFLRFLHLLGHYDWLRSPLIVNVDDTLGIDEYNSISEHFRLGRESDTLPAMFIATPHDHTHSVFTAEKPSKQLLLRAVAFARESEKHFLGLLHTGAAEAEESLLLFRTPLTDYNALIYLKHDALTRYPENINYEPPVRVVCCGRPARAVLSVLILCFPLYQIEGRLDEAQVQEFGDSQGVGQLYPVRPCLRVPADVAFCVWWRGALLP
eukprot:m.160629 g.160629  ORF g.160629 m.160629 type:complete len:267 (-) comp10276_c0_seq3:271-1071(-)